MFFFPECLGEAKLDPVTGRSPPTRLALALLSALALATLWPSAVRGAEARSSSQRHAKAVELSAQERAQIRAGARVERPFRFEDHGGKYVGGIAYQLVRESAPVVLSALLDARQLPAMLPRTRSARLIDTRDGLTRVELEQGQAPFVARYTVVLKAVSSSELRFWIDGSRPRDLRDVFGFFRAEPFGNERTLVTLGAAVDLGPSLVRGWLEDRVERVVLSSVTGIRDFLEPRHLAAVGYGECPRCRPLPQ